MTVRCSGAMLHTCIPQGNNQHCRAAQRSNAALLCLAILQAAILCTLTVDITTDYPPPYPASRYYNCSTDYPFCSLWRYSNRPSAMLFSFKRYNNRVSNQLCPSILQSSIRSLLIIQSTIRSTLPVDITSDYPLYSIWRYYNRLSAVLLCSLYVF
jgi:hypothetical protein